LATEKRPFCPKNLCDQKKSVEDFGDYAATIKELGIDLSLGENYLDGFKGQDIIMRTPGFVVAQSHVGTQLHKLLDQGLVADTGTNEGLFFAFDEFNQFLLILLHKNSSSSIISYSERRQNTIAEL